MTARAHTQPQRVEYAIQSMRSLDFSKLVFGSAKQEQEEEKKATRAMNLLVFGVPPRDPTTHQPLLGANVHYWLTFLRTLQTSSRNGVVAFGHITKANPAFRHAKLILKTPMAEDEDHEADPIEYEFVVQTVLNYLRDRIPNFTFAFALFRCRALLVPRGKDKWNITEFCSSKPLVSKKGQRSDFYSFLLVEHVNPGIPFYKLWFHLGKEKARCDRKVLPALWLSHLCQILLAVQIAQYHVGFTHWDLHYDNVLVQSLQHCCAHKLPTKRVWFYYHYKGKVYRLPTEWLLMVIDFGKAYVTLKMRKEVAKMYRLPKEAYWPTDLYESWHGARRQYYINAQKFSPVHDMLRFTLSTFDLCPAYIQKDPVCQQVVLLLEKEFPDYRSEAMDEFGTRYWQGSKNGVLNKPLDLVHFILETGVLDTIPMDKNAPIFYWNDLPQRSVHP